MKATQRITSALLVLAALNNVAQAFAPPSSQQSRSLHTLVARPTVRQNLNHDTNTNRIQQIQIKNTNARQAKTSLQAVATTTVAAITGAVTGGIFAGGLHAIAGECFFFYF